MITSEKTIKQKLVILGTRSYAEEVADFIKEIDTYELEGFVESEYPEKCEQTKLGLPITWIEDIAQVGNTCKGISGIGGAPERKGIIDQASFLGLEFITIVHSTAHVAPTVALGQGTIVGPGSIIAAHTSIGKQTIINRGCLIGHHTKIGDYVTVSPGANIAGNTTIGDGTYIAMGAIVLDHITVGKNVIVGAGAVVTKDVPDNVQVIGLPARIVKELK